MMKGKELIVVAKKTGWWNGLPRWAQGIIVIVTGWLVYRVTIIFFPDLWMEVLGFLGLGSGAAMMSSKHKSLRQKEIQDTEADKKELAQARVDIEQAKAGLEDLRGQQTAVMLNTDKELESELNKLSEAKREIAESDMTEEQAESFLRERLFKRKRS